MKFICNKLHVISGRLTLDLIRLLFHFSYTLVSIDCVITKMKTTIMMWKTFYFALYTWIYTILVRSCHIVRHIEIVMTAPNARKPITVHSLIRFVLFFRYSLTKYNLIDCKSKCFCFFPDFFHYECKVRQPCSSLIINCTWNDVPFDCCRYFLPIQTTLGKCYLLNSIQITKK